ncbi:ABC transporter ATP-binding protein [Alicyclobacillus fastidiosus]|uniref:ABC transporter ATP-binding protein n=1 Tax=Alicyclobacillus fastidiosus TaxID=392011 RepID=A0ABY6ZC88_9BACL|nr:ABC transporter ATP-binding protein [Alicyclobacillus fastidiosus]WAH40504.1 ABC transporter ATP-binding protein [Alicyclobacillus fastidiosus]GMA61921.1 peptide ABC transporter ATP-binding protein [Alicyclobacillus fastidiosus]
MSHQDSDVVLSVRDLSVVYGAPAKGRKRKSAPPAVAVDHVSLDLKAGECIGLIGESGSGKSTFGYAIMNLLPKPGRITNGKIELLGSGDLVRLDNRRLAAIRGKQIGMVFQGAQSMFNPLMTIQDHLRDIFRVHGVDNQTGLNEAKELMNRARLDVGRVLRSYPHELSGGMRQRVAIVASVMMKPDVLILDEPTTALDALSQTLVLDILRDIRSVQSMAMIFITHDFAVASNIGDRIAVMYAGQMVEVGPVLDVYRRASHPYTRGLIASVPSLTRADGELAGVPGQPPNMSDLPKGCRFADRCNLVTEQCRTRVPETLTVGNEHDVMCVRAIEIGEEVSVHV